MKFEFIVRNTYGKYMIQLKQTKYEAFNWND